MCEEDAINAVGQAQNQSEGEYTTIVHIRGKVRVEAELEEI